VVFDSILTGQLDGDLSIQDYRDIWTAMQLPSVKKYLYRMMFATIKEFRDEEKSGNKATAEFQNGYMKGAFDAYENILIADLLAQEKISKLSESKNERAEFTNQEADLEI